MWLLLFSVVVCSVVGVRGVIAVGVDVVAAVASCVVVAIVEMGVASICVLLGVAICGGGVYVGSGYVVWHGCADINTRSTIGVGWAPERDLRRFGHALL